VARNKSSFHQEIEEEESSLKLKIKRPEMLMGCFRYRIGGARK
jgi:hypothetical protein